MKLTVCRTLALRRPGAGWCRPAAAHAQGVTTGAITGIVTDAQQQPVPGARVVASTSLGHDLRSHDPRGRPLLDPRHARRRTVHRHGVRSAGFQPQMTKDVTVNLGVATDLDLT